MSSALLASTAYALYRWLREVTVTMLPVNDLAGDIRASRPRICVTPAALATADGCTGHLQTICPGRSSLGRGGSSCRNPLSILLPLS